MDFIFQGFQSSLPIWVYILLLVATAAVAWWSYKEVSGIRPFYRYVLIFLRTSVFFILFLLLINPYIKTETSFTERPQILVMLDNSESISIEKNNYKGAESYREVLETLNFSDSSSVNFDFYTIGKSTESTSLDSLSFDAEQTNLSESLQAIKTHQRGASAAILISDGIYTQGQNPVYEAGDLEIPVFTVGIGDTTSQKDILVRSVSTNSTGYLNTNHPVSATVAGNGFKDQSFEVQLRDGDQTVSTQTVTPALQNFTEELTFEIPLQEEGLQQFEIFIPELVQEWTADNNTQRFSVNVQDARQNIYSIAFEVHPDVKYIRSLLAEDKNTNLTNRTWINGNRFIEGTFNPDPDSVDLAIIHGYPSSGLSTDAEQKLKTLSENVPFIVFSTPLFAPQQFDEEITSLPVQINGSWSYVPIQLGPRDVDNSHPILELPAIEYGQLPRLSGPIENLENGSAAATTLFSSIYQDEDTGKPVFQVQEIGNKRLAFISSFGWFRFNQNTNQQIRTYGRELLMNTVSWTAENPDNELLEVEPAQTTFSGAENVVINAYLRNERGGMEPDGRVGLTISTDTTEERSYSMESMGSGRYRIDLGTMSEGIYSFQATAEKEGRELGTKSGEFAVTRSNAEFINTTRNDQLLRQVADRSGGSFFAFDSLSTFWDELSQQELLEQVEKQDTHFFYPYQHWGWFVLVVLLLSGEWIFRKYLSLP